MRKFTSNKGQFVCCICDTTYQYSDLRDICEGRPYYNHPDKHDHSLDVLDRLKASIGEKVLVTQYHGDDYAPEGYKQGIFLTYRWDFIRDRRIIPSIQDRFVYMHKAYRHFAEYRIGERSNEEIELAGDQWDVSYLMGSYSTVGAIGPRHVWTKASVEAEGNEWPNYVIDLCAGEKSKDLLIKKRDEGYYIQDYEIDAL